MFGAQPIVAATFVTHKSGGMQTRTEEITTPNGPMGVRFALPARTVWCLAGDGLAMLECRDPVG
jgi:hypothetical protein